MCYRVTYNGYFRKDRVQQFVNYGAPIKNPPSRGFFMPQFKYTPITETTPKHNVTALRREKLSVLNKTERINTNSNETTKKKKR